MKMCEAMTALGYVVVLYHSSPGADTWSPEDQPRIFAEYGIRHPFHMVNMASRGGVFRHLLGMRVAMHIARRSGSALVFSRFLPASAWCSLSGLATIHEIHTPPETASERIYLRVMLAGRGFRKLVAITRALAGELQKHVTGPSRADILVEADGVNPDEYGGDKSRPLPGDIAGLAGRRPLIGYIGSLHPGKGAEMLVPVAKRTPALQFMVVGGPDDVAEKYRQQAEAEGVKNIAWLGFRKNVEVPAYVQACDVVLLPNQRSVVLLNRKNIGQWTSPLKLFEYMAAGKIILASDLPVLREVLNPANSVLCDPEDPSSWVVHLDRICRGEQGYAALADRARKDVEYYSWSKRAARCLGAATGTSNERVA
jgi:glycosyltransferase involved in cell wall biosynthesis